MLCQIGNKFQQQLKEDNFLFDHSHPIFPVNFFIFVKGPIFGSFRGFKCPTINGNNLSKTHISQAVCLALKWFNEQQLSACGLLNLPVFEKLTTITFNSSIKKPSNTINYQILKNVNSKPFKQIMDQIWRETS